MHLDVALAYDASAVGDMHVFEAMDMSRQVAADPGRAIKREVASSHAEITPNISAHVGIAGGDGHAARYLAFQNNVTGGNHDAVPHAGLVIHAQGSDQGVDAAAQLSTQVQRLRKGVDVAIHGSADLGSLRPCQQVTLDPAPYFHRPASSQLVRVYYTFHPHGITVRASSLVHRPLRPYANAPRVTTRLPSARQRQRQQHDQKSN